MLKNPRLSKSIWEPAQFLYAKNTAPIFISKRSEFEAQNVDTCFYLNLKIRTSMPPRQKLPMNTCYLGELRGFTLLQLSRRSDQHEMVKDKSRPIFLWLRCRGLVYGPGKRFFTTRTMDCANIKMRTREYLNLDEKFD